MPATRRSLGSAARHAEADASRRPRCPARSASASGTSTAPPSRSAAKASSRDAPVMISPSWSAKTFGSIPASAASSWPSTVTRTTGSSSTGLATARPGVASNDARKASMSSGTPLRMAWPPGRIEATRRSVAARADSATVPRATTAARPIIIAPTVRPVRARSRDRLARPRRPCAPKNHSNGRPMTRPSGSSTIGGRDRAADEERQRQRDRDDRRARRSRNAASARPASTTSSSARTSGRSRSLRPRSPRRGGRSASSGERRAARMAGSTAPSIVMSRPRRKAASRPPIGSGRPTTSTARVVDRKPIIAAASAMPATHPEGAADDAERERLAHDDARGPGARSSRPHGAARARASARRRSWPGCCRRGTRRPRGRPRRRAARLPRSPPGPMRTAPRHRPGSRPRTARPAWPSTASICSAVGASPRSRST